MFVDMPPGTGDVPLTVFQSLPLDGIVVVTSPQELVEMIVEKAVKMAGLMDIPVLGLVENMAYFECPNCHERHYIFGQSHIDGPSHGRYFIPPQHICPILPWHSLRCPVYLPYPDIHVITVRARDFYLVVHSLEETQLLIPPPCFQ